MTVKSGSKKHSSSYARAGVDIDAKMRSIDGIRKMALGTTTKGVLSHIGSFGGLFASPGKDEILVASADGVGTKLKVAVMTGNHTTVGQDIVNHCVNDILVQGARPLFFLDYLGTSKLQPQIFHDIVKGLCAACRRNQCALIGGETAELPNLYPAGEYDLVGAIVGAVPRRRLVTGKHVRAGDIIIGLRSSGLHTNGYSLARKIVFETAGLTADDQFPGAGRTVGDVLLTVHKSYLRPVTRVMESVPVQAMAHITGGGLIDNIPRVLPGNMTAVIELGSWKIPPVFTFLRQTGQVDAEEMYRVFNMGIGYVLIVRESDAHGAMDILNAAGCKCDLIGYTKKGRRCVTFTGGVRR